MKKEKKYFRCQKCGASSPKWTGQCDACREWNTLVKKEEIPSSSAAEMLVCNAPSEKISQNRLSSGFAEYDLVLGGGYFFGSLSLLVGNPGIGKSTIALQSAFCIAQKNPEESVLIVSGEESVFQIRSRLDRLGGSAKNLSIATAFFVEDIVLTAEKIRPRFLVVDSVQTIASREVSSGPASLSQIRAVTEALMHFAKKSGVPILLIGQVNKDGDMAGPQTLAHLVDTVISFEGDENHELRLLRALKNRFGSTSEVGVFEMTEKGLSEVSNPSTAFLSGRLPKAIGSAIFPTLEGNRPFLVEIQALTATSPFGLPKRSGSGFSLQRLALLLAVLEKHAGVKLASQDVFANIVGGFKISETAADLALCLALASSQKKQPLSENMMILGEVGLSGEVRAVSHLQKRLNEGKKLGFSRAIIPASGKISSAIKNINLFPVRTLREAMVLMG